MRLRPVKHIIKVPTHMIRAESIRGRLFGIALLPFQRRIRAARQRGLDVLKAVPNVPHHKALIHFLLHAASVAAVPARKEIVKLLGQHVQAMQLVEYGDVVQVLAVRVDRFWQGFALPVLNGHEAAAH